jgi:hypothetical protein
MPESYTPQKRRWYFTAQTADDLPALPDALIKAVNDDDAYESAMDRVFPRGKEERPCWNCKAHGLWRQVPELVPGASHLCDGCIRGLVELIRAVARKDVQRAKALACEFIAEGEASDSNALN